MVDPTLTTTNPALVSDRPLATGPGTDPDISPEMTPDTDLVYLEPPEDRPPFYVNGEEYPLPDTSALRIEDDTPVDNFYSEKQQRLLVDPLYSNAVLPTPFIAAANVGVFPSIRQEEIVPDVFVSVGAQMSTDWSRKRNRTYMIWEMGKAPDVGIEIVSNRVGQELDRKKKRYADLRFLYYVVFDPLGQIQEPARMDGQPLRGFQLGGRGADSSGYGPMEFPLFIPPLGLGLTLWEGVFEEQPGLWLRWCDGEGALIPTGAERAEQERQRAEQERQRAEQERQRADRLAERLRALGIDPEALEA